MIDIFTIRGYFLKMIGNIISFFARLINWYNDFYSLNEIYRLTINKNSINKYNYSKLYFNILYTCYNFPLLYPLYYIFYMLNPIISDIYVLNIKHNNYNYKLIVDNTNDNNIDMIFKFKDYILLNEIFDMKSINLKYSNDPLNTNSDIININQYVFNNTYQTLEYILIDINSEYNTLNYLIPIQIEITDLIDESINVKFKINDEIFKSNLSIICEQYILNN